MIAVGLSSMPRFTRVMQAEVLSIRTRDYVVAAQSMGAPTSIILLRHILPNALSSVLVLSTLSISTAILAEATLSFLGLGPRPPTATWGSMISDGTSVLQNAPWVVLFPGLAITADGPRLQLARRRPARRTRRPPARPLSQNTERSAMVTINPRVESTVPADLLAQLRQIAPATIGHMLDHEFMDPELRPIISRFAFAGPAVTVRAHGMDNAIVHYAIDIAQPGDVVIVDRLGDRRYACWGGGVALAAHVKGIVGAVVDGVLTDRVEIEELHFPVFGRGISALTTRAPGSQRRIECCGPLRRHHRQSGRHHSGRRRRHRRPAA